MKQLLNRITDTLADAALLEEGAPAALPSAKAGGGRETLEELLVEVAFAEASEYEGMHEAILSEHRSVRDIVRPDGCQYGDDDTCFRDAA